MKSVTLLILATLLLSGCATTTPKPIMPTVGNFTSITKASNEQLASDAVEQLKEIYPPASTELQLAQPYDDYFGAAFIKELRRSGYGLHEITTVTDHDINLSYTIDSLDEKSIYLTVSIGSQNLSRAYISQNGKMIPTGSWVHKEQ